MKKTIFVVDDIAAKEQMSGQTAQPSLDTKYAKGFIRTMNKHITRLAEILAKNGKYDNSDLLTYSINNLAIKDALAGVGELELSKVAEKLEQAGMEKNIDIISSETPGFLDALRFIISKYTNAY